MKQTVDPPPGKDAGGKSDGTVTITDSEVVDGLEPDEIKVTKCDVTEVVLVQLC